MEDSAIIKKTGIAVIFLGLMTAVALYIGAPARFQSQEPGQGDAAAFYQGAAIRWIIPNNPGGGYDEYARLLAPYLEKYTGARVRLTNIPGSGGMRALGELFKSPADGLTIGLVNGSGMVTSQIVDAGDAGFSIEELSFLGRVTRDQRVLTLAETSRFKSFSDILAASEPVKIGATGFGGSTYVDAVVSRDLFALNVNVIHGFNNSSAMRLAMLRGNLDGAWSSLGSVVDDLASGRIVIALQTGHNRDAALPDVPAIFEFVDKTNDPALAGRIMTALEELHDVGRPVAAPPGIPVARLAFLREALRQALYDPEFIQAAAKSGRTINYVSGEDLENIIMQALDVPADIRQFLDQSMNSEL